MFLGSPAQDNLHFCFHDKKCVHFFQGSTEKTTKLYAMSCNAKVQHVQYFAPDFGISQLSILWSSNSFQLHNDETGHTVAIFEETPAMICDGL